MLGPPLAPGPCLVCGKPHTACTSPDYVPPTGLQRRILVTPARELPPVAIVLQTSGLTTVEADE